MFESVSGIQLEKRLEENLPFGFSVVHNTTVNVTRARRRGKSATKFFVPVAMFISSLLCKFLTENIKLQKIFHVKVVKKLYFWAFFWTKNVTKTFSSVTFNETNKIFAIKGKKTLPILIAFVQTRNTAAIK